MRTLTAVLLVTFVAMLVSAGVAQTPAKVRASGDRLVGLRALDLTKDQAQQIRGIIRQYRVDAAVVMKGPGTPLEKRQSIQPIRAKAAEAIAAVLTPDQLAKTREKGIIQRMLSRATMRQAGLMALVKRLDLTESQKTQVKAIFDESQAKAKAIRGDSSLSLEQKKAARTELRKATREKIMAILTPEQQQKMKQMLQKQRRKPRVGS